MPWAVATNCHLRGTTRLLNRSACRNIALGRSLNYCRLITTPSISRHVSNWTNSSGPSQLPIASKSNNAKPSSTSRIEPGFYSWMKIVRPAMPRHSSKFTRWFLRTLWFPRGGLRTWAESYIFRFDYERDRVGSLAVRWKSFEAMQSAHHYFSSQSHSVVTFHPGLGELSRRS
ncbi:hypothetical protein BT69DRAFT_643647 [Atractiella rhizophila]|nr:hypothetical protein BT69DRAFT_643647 [Atractiella rhizophila]